MKLYAFMHCVKNLTPYLIGTVRTDHFRNLLYLSNSSVPKLVCWRFPLLEFQFFVQHIPGDQNIVVDGLTRVSRTTLMELPKHKRHLYVDDSIQCIFRLKEERLEETEIPREAKKTITIWKCTKYSQDTTTQSLDIWVWSEH